MSVFISWLLEEQPKPFNWQEVYAEYIGLRENKNSQAILELVKEISYLETKKFITDKLLEVLFDIPSPLLISELKGLGWRGSFNWNDREKYYSELNAIKSASKRLITQISRKANELKIFQEKYGGKTYDRREFNSTAILLGKYMGYRIDLNVTTIVEWCEMLNSYDRYCEIKNSEANNIWQKTG